MLNKLKMEKLQASIKSYCKTYLGGKFSELDESGTRIMVNHFLTEVLGFAPLEEVKTEYMIKGTYADYVIQTESNRHFLVEVKAFSIPLSASHLRQAVNYGANEGIEWALLTNGRVFEFYKILFTKPIDSKLIFSIDLSDPVKAKESHKKIQFLCKDSIKSDGLSSLWNKTEALDPALVAAILKSDSVVNCIKKSLKEQFDTKFSDEEIVNSINRIICEPIQLESLKQIKTKKKKPLLKPVAEVNPETAAVENQELNQN